eukprot:8497946-Ditylum_brightwellii.AAC.1
MKESNSCNVGEDDDLVSVSNDNYRYIPNLIDQCDSNSEEKEDWFNADNSDKKDGIENDCKEEVATDDMEVSVSQQQC